MRKIWKEIAQLFCQSSECRDWVLDFTLDSRRVKPGSLFFALRGKNVDGHDFLNEIARQGAIGAIVSEDYRGPHFGLQLIRVKDVVQALHLLARGMIVKNLPYVIGVTGSVGKTTTKEFIATLLSEKFSVAKNEGNMNSQVGLPLALLNWGGKEEVIVLEMGMSEAGEIKRLVDIASPDLGVLTHIDYQHSAFFNSLEEIAYAKSELFSSFKTKQGVLNLETQGFKAIQELPVSKIWFHLYDPYAHYSLCKLPIHAPFAESHIQENFLAAVSVARYFNLSWEEIDRGAKMLKMPEHRFQKIEKGGVCFIDDSYNASPLSMKAALNNLPKGRRRIALLGMMRELGFMQEVIHEEVGQCAVKVLDSLICVGRECESMIKPFKKVGKEAVIFETKEEAAKHLKSMIQIGDVVLIKGSNRLKLWDIIEGI